MKDLDDIICDKTRAKAERIVLEFIDAICFYNDNELTGNIGIQAHVSKGALMKADLDIHRGVRLK